MRDQSSIIPSKIAVRFRGRRCSGAVSSTIPAFYVKNVTLKQAGFDFDGFSGTKQFHDSALALFAGGGTTPTNQAALDNLAIQIATEYVNWLQDSFDESYPQIIKPNPIDATTDTIEFTYTQNQIQTRRYSSPYNGQPEEMQHHDPANSACVDSSGVTVEQTPCIVFYGPPGTCVSGKPNLTRYKVCFQDGMLKQTYISTDVVT